MAVLVHVVLPGVTREQYDAVREEVGWLDTPPDGGLVHTTWWEDDDNHNLDAWESEEHFARFGQDRLGPAMAKLGSEAEVMPTFHSAQEVFAPEAVKVTLTE